MINSCCQNAQPCRPLGATTEDSLPVEIETTASDGVHEPLGGQCEEAAPVEGCTLSKKQQKKMAKRARVHAHYEQKKEQERQDKLCKKQQRLKEWDALTEEEKVRKRQKRIENIISQKDSNAARKTAFLEALSRGPRVVIDVDYVDKMGEKDLRSLGQQLMISYASLRKSPSPVHLTICGLQPDTYLSQNLREKTGASCWPIPIKASPFYDELEDKASVVYLTADSDNVLFTLEPHKVYVIGGLVDHNTFPGLSLNRALQYGVSHARLPFQEHLDPKKLSKFSRVLTVNHMVDVLCAFNASGDWVEVFEKSVPSRKGLVIRQAEEISTSSKDVNGEDTS